MSTTNKRQLTDKTMVQVFNNSIGDVGYTIENGSYKVRRTWRTPSTMQEVEFKELKTAINEPGVRQLFEEYNKELRRYEDGELLIKNEQVREKLGLQPIGKYTLDQKEIIELLKSGSISKLEETLENCPNITIEKIIQEAINMSLSDIVKINIIKEYSGKDILGIINQKTEESQSENKRKKETETNTSGKRTKK